MQVCLASFQDEVQKALLTFMNHVVPAFLWLYLFDCWVLKTVIVVCVMSQIARTGTSAVGLKFCLLVVFFLKILSQCILGLRALASRLTLFQGPRGFFKTSGHGSTYCHGVHERQIARSDQI